jgi:hypothetical protein
MDQPACAPFSDVQVWLPSCRCDFVPSAFLPGAPPSFCALHCTGSGTNAAASGRATEARKKGVRRGVRGRCLLFSLCRPFSLLSLPPCRCLLCWNLPQTAAEPEAQQTETPRPAPPAVEDGDCGADSRRTQREAEEHSVFDLLHSAALLDAAGKHVRSACCTVGIGREEEHRLQQRQTRRSCAGRRRPTGVAEGAFDSPVRRAHTCSPRARSVPLPSAHALPFHQLRARPVDKGQLPGARNGCPELSLRLTVPPPCLCLLCAVMPLCVL